MVPGAVRCAAFGADEPDAVRWPIRKPFRFRPRVRVPYSTAIDRTARITWPIVIPVSPSASRNITSW